MKMSDYSLIQRPRRLRASASMREMFQESSLSLNDLALPIFVEEEVDDYKAIQAMPGVMRIPEKRLAYEIERIAKAGIRSVMTFGISHHTDATGSDAWNENGLVARMSLLAKMAQGFSVGGEYTGASIFVAEYSPDRKRGFMGSWLDFGSIAGFVLGAGLVVLISSIIGEESFLEWGWRLPFFVALPLGIIGLYLRHALEETPAFQQHVELNRQSCHIHSSFCSPPCDAKG